MMCFRSSCDTKYKYKCCYKRSDISHDLNIETRSNMALISPTPGNSTRFISFLLQSKIHLLLHISSNIKHSKCFDHFTNAVCYNLRSTLFRIIQSNYLKRGQYFGWTRVGARARSLTICETISHTKSEVISQLPLSLGSGQTQS